MKWTITMILFFGLFSCMKYGPSGYGGEFEVFSPNEPKNIIQPNNWAMARFTVQGVGQPYEYWFGDQDMDMFAGSYYIEGKESAFLFKNDNISFCLKLMVDTIGNRILKFDTLHGFPIVALSGYDTIAFVTPQDQLYLNVYNTGRMYGSFKFSGDFRSSYHTLFSGPNTRTIQGQFYNLRL